MNRTFSNTGPKSKHQRVYKYILIISYYFRFVNLCKKDLLYIIILNLITHCHKGSQIAEKVQIMNETLTINTV